VERYPIARNVLLLSGTLTCLSGMIQLAVAVGTTTLVLVTGIEGILGLGPAIFLSFAALAAFPAGRAMDRRGRRPVIATGCAVGIAGCVLAALGARFELAPLVILGFAGVGASQGTVLLSRAAVADMFAPARRPRAISLVLFGAVAGAVLGPFVFGPLFSGKGLDPQELLVPWLAAAGFMAIGLGLVLCVRPDPKRIAVELFGEPVRTAATATVPLRELLALPGVVRALVAAVASFAVMVAVMNLTGYVMVDRGHAQSDVFPVISAHILGMYGLVLVVGDLIERLGRRRALVGGLGVMAVSTLGLAWLQGSFATGAALFGLGLGWSFSYVAATSELVDLAPAVERLRLIGFSDLLSSGTGAALCLVGGAVYSGAGAATFAVGAAVAATVPAVLMTLAGRPGEALEPA
jgi:MFS family permease